MAITQNPTSFSIAFGFSKRGPLRYISHLDTMRLLLRAARRAQLPLFITQGFHPHAKLKLQRALKLGVESEHEAGEILLTKPLPFRVFEKKINKHLPDGIQIHTAPTQCIER